MLYIFWISIINASFRSKTLWKTICPCLNVGFSRQLDWVYNYNSCFIKLLYIFIHNCPPKNKIVWKNENFLKSLSNTRRLLIFHKMNVYDMFKYFDHFKYKLNSTYLYVTMIGLLLDYKKNPESIIWDFSTIFNSCLDIIGPFWI